MDNTLKTQIAVIGAGHAGIEAALAAARIGVDTVLFTMNLDAVANLPCNPSIGGSAKGHLVFEIDALGGEMGRCADVATIQSRTLNLGKGAAVHSKRVQADRAVYKSVMKRTLENQKRLRLVQAEIVEILYENGRVTGVKTSLDEIWEAEKVVIATGTFLESEIFVGDKVFSAGPDGMLSARGLSASLRSIGIELMRFKTGTPARINRRSIDFSGLEEQKGEDNPTPYSLLTGEDYGEDINKVSCHNPSKNTLFARRSNRNKSALGMLRCRNPVRNIRRSWRISGLLNLTIITQTIHRGSDGPRIFYSTLKSPLSFIKKSLTFVTALLTAFFPLLVILTAPIAASAPIVKIAPTPRLFRSLFLKNIAIFSFSTF